MNDPGGHVGRPVVDDQGKIEAAARLDAGGDAGRAEPCGGGHAHGATPSAREAGRLRQAEHQVGVLDRLAGGALAEIVDRAGHDDPAGVEIDHRLQLRGVRPGRRGRTGLAPGRQDVDERLAGVGSREHVVHLLGRHSGSGRNETDVRIPRGIGARTGVMVRLVMPAACLISGTWRCAPTL